MWLSVRMCVRVSSFKKQQTVVLLWHHLSDLGVSDLLVDGGRLHLLQRTHDAVLLAAVGLNPGVHPVRVEHDVVGCDQQHPAHCALNETEGWLSNNPPEKTFANSI